MREEATGHVGWGGGMVLLHDDRTSPVFTHTICATTESHINRYPAHHIPENTSICEGEEVPNS